ncbi:SNF2 family N-terminal domain-containing protein [Cokeromyces recurvatus]|uniref:SNF2 family N-terminal domain-containing protein n=1 Tax=Cokeromyces recurvatus TaxID=90255 RepID=UPI0022210C22|nr:SNF2 family N-terminal domain-containing protein [Cokeromyces recurvatus]KAI7901569.1 SNF2 family N-terminal domain-containing protein [Cokeromyces recurvatus]
MADFDTLSKNKNDENAKLKQARLTKRARQIEEKVKNKKVKSLFDTDGDLSRHNIIEGSRQARKRASSSDSNQTQQKKTKKETLRRKTTTNLKNELLPEPKTPIQRLRNQEMGKKLICMQEVCQRHDASVKELYHLELFQNMLDYNPKAFINDVRYNKYVQDYDMWQHIKSQESSLHDSSIINLLQAIIYESVYNIPNEITQQQLFNTIHTGTGLRRQNRQFATLNDYLDSFYAADEGAEDWTPEMREHYIKKERIIRKRLYALEKRGGFSTHLQTIANQRPHHHHHHSKSLHHTNLLNNISTASKQFQAVQRYKRNAARKCAKAIDRYWDNIRNHDERIRREETKRMIRLAKWTSQQVKRKWKLIERICEARLKEILKGEQAEEGRRHLEMILEHSEQMLGARQEELRAHQCIEEDDKVWEINEDEDLQDHIIEEDEESRDDEEELKDLEEDQHLSIEELMEKYRSLREANDSDTTQLEENDDIQSMQNSDEEFSIVSDNEDIPIEDDGESEDDNVELNILHDEANLTVEELLQKYNYKVDDDENMNASQRSSSPESTPTVDSLLLSMNKEEEILKYRNQNDDDDDNDDDNDENRSFITNDVSAMIDKDMDSNIQPTGNTLDTTKVRTPVPFLIRGKLREYQHVGLDWLASLYNNGLNGILADEMGLGKTIQTIALLAYLACEKGVWGPHLVVVPTSVILNWEMEFKKWLPGFKIMTYYGSPKERKEKRSGWSKDNAFHVCITSYQLVLQDQNAFRRKAWHYLILDEAHHIKNFRSQRWQILLNFNSKHRLLLTGTPLQNNLIELWSLLYFLMPNTVSQSMPIGFANLKEFQEWFAHPVDRMIENHQQQGMDEESRVAIQKLHTVLRPYLLRRIKADVEKQMPEKHEHIVYCRLSKRQRFLYDDFMSRAKTKETLASGHFLSIINCLMQLRKVCNHPDLFEERPILTSFAMDDQVQYLGQSLEKLIRRRLVWTKNDQLEAHTKINFEFLNLILTDTSNNRVISASVAQDTLRLEATKEIMSVIAKYQKRIMIAESRGVTSRDYHDLKKYAKYREMQMHLDTVSRWQMINYVNHYRCAKRPIYDASLIDLIRPSTRDDYIFSHNPRFYLQNCESLYNAVQSYKERIENNSYLIEQVAFVTPKIVIAQDKRRVFSLEHLPADVQVQLQTATNVENDILHPIKSRLSIAFPDKRLLQYDCGKLQKLDTLLRSLAAGGHRALIFTQMTKVLDILETFLNMHGYRYLRLDGATKVEQRQVLTECFNNDKRILCFILSSRSGGLGINLTGADTVIFYDSDWNPSMDKQCQDRAHRIGQTRDVHIYRFVTEFTIEENIFKKANQKRMLDNIVIQEGDFTNDYFSKNEWWKNLPEVVGAQTDNNANKFIDYEQALLEAEDESDAAAAIEARKEMNMDEKEFDDQTSTSTATPHRQLSEVPSSRPMSPSSASQIQSNEYIVNEDDNENDDMQLDIGHVDQYMLQFWEREMVGRNLGFGGFAVEITE